MTSPDRFSPPSESAILNWLAPLPDFRNALAEARKLQGTDWYFERLAALAGYRLSFLETIQLDRVLGQAPTRPAGYTSLRLALVGSSTLEHLAAPIRVAGVRRKLLIEVHVGGFGQYRQELLDPSSDLHAYRPDLILLSLSPREAIAGIPLNASGEDADASLEAWLEGLVQLWRSAKETLGATVLQQTFLGLADSVFGSFDRQVPGSTARLVSRLNERIARLAAEEGVHLVDLAGVSQRDGLDLWWDRTRWLQGKFEIAPQAAPAYGELSTRVMAALRGLSRKCLVLDLDNTLWGGVIGDDGIEGIVLGEGSAIGEAHLAMQHYAKTLRERGIILAVCSKNDLVTAEAAFRDHPEMVLKRSDFAAFVANWEDKAHNLRMIAEDLNIGLDSLVFVDDNPAERARVRQSLPMVAVPELPTDAAFYVPCLAESGLFEAITFTAEDQQRGQQYAANASREALRRSSGSLDVFLGTLEMELECGPITPVDLSRVVQLINKTNQFNPTTRRYSVEEVAAFSRDQGITLQFRLRDRFGDNGLVSAMILRPVDGDASQMRIDTWVMSCRVFSRQLEDEAMNVAVDAARARGVSALLAEYLPTPKNGVVRELFSGLGFDRADTAPSTDGVTHWVLPLARYVARPTFITRRNQIHQLV